MKKKYCLIGAACISLMVLFLGSMTLHAQEKSVRLTCKSMTVQKGQYALIGLKGVADLAKVKWSVTGKAVKIHEIDRDGFCSIKAVRTGTGTVICAVNNKIRKCRVKVVADHAWIGDFTDAQEEVHLRIYKNDKKYVAFYGQYRLAQMDWLTGTVKNGVLSLEGTDPADHPITVTLAQEGSKWMFTFQKTSWEYFNQGSTISLKKYNRV